MLTQVRVRELLHYSIITGELYWLKPTSRRVKLWDRAGTRDQYLKIRIDGTLYNGHRVIWLWVTGSWPANLIEHKDGKGLNNTWLNLREATYTQNNQNKIAKGYYFDARQNRWSTKIHVNGRCIYLGGFKSEEEAVSAYNKAAQFYFGEYAHDSTRS